MDISFETTPAEAAAAVSSTKADTAASLPVVAEDDPRLVALRAAGAALISAAGLADTDTLEVSLAMSDDPGWAVVRVAKLVREP